MRATLTSLIFAGLLIVVFVHYGNRLPQFKKDSISDEFKAAEPKDSDPREIDPTQVEQNPDKLTTVDGPLARWMKAAEDAFEKRAPWKPTPSDHIAPSPVGTGGVVLRKTFFITTGASFPFTIPAHAAMPQLLGNFHSSAHADANSSADENSDIAFLLLNEDQYDGLIHGHLADALLSVDSSHNQDVNFGLPASLNRPVKYYLVFRNNPGEARKTVQADFSVKF